MPAKCLMRLMLWAREELRVRFGIILELLKKAPKIDKSLPPLKPKAKAPKEEKKVVVQKKREPEFKEAGNQVFIVRV